MKLSLTNLPLKTFIDCLVDGNLSGLPGTQKQREELWEAISIEYAEALGDSEQKIYVNLFKDINALQIKLQQIDLLIQCLANYYVPLFADKLNKLLFTNFKFDIEKPEEYNENLKRCVSRAKTSRISLEIKMKDFEAIQKKHQNKAEKPTREYFISLLTTLSNHVQYMVPDTISVFEFTDRLKRLTKEAETFKNTK